MSRVSFFGLFIFFTCLLLTLISRFMFPFADEPDWTVRAPRVLFGEHPVWSPYYLFSEWFNRLDINNAACQVDAGALSLWASIPTSCTEDLIQIVIRWVTTLIILLPMFLIIVFRRSFIRIANILSVRLSNEEWNLRIDSLALTLIFPSVLYYLGILAEEQLYLVVALYIFLFWGFWLPITGLFVILLSIDFGNSIVALFFILLMTVFARIRRLKRSLFFLGLLFLISFALILGYRFLEIFLQLDFLPEYFLYKSEAMFNALDGSDFLTKYPIFLRPVITFMTFVFMTPSGIKVPLLYVVFGFLFFIVSLRAFKKADGNMDLFWFVPFSIIAFFVFLFPTYGNAKYYIFMMPFFVYVALKFYPRKNILILFSFSSVFVFLNLFMYRF